MNISLTRKLEAMVHQKVRSGMYNSASEVIREALRILQEREELRLSQLRRDIAIGIAQAKRGETGPLDIKAVKAKARATRKPAR